MRNLILFIFIIFSLYFAPLTFSQESDNSLYIKVDYMKASPENISSYLQVERELWKPIHEERYNQGIILGWSFYSVFVGEPDVPYNYIAVNFFDDFEKIDYYRLNDLVEEIYPDRDLGEFYQQTRASREVVRTEIWQVNEIIQSPEQILPKGNYITKNFFDSRGGSGEHEEMELGFWGGIHEVRVEKDILNSWAMFTLYYPAGDARHYTYSTVDYYDRLGDLTIGAGIDLARIAHPEMDDDEINNFFSRTGESRSLYKTEIWKKEDSVGHD